MLANFIGCPQESEFITVNEDFILVLLNILDEISLKYLMQGEKVDEKDFLHRVDLLNMMGQNVMVSKFYRYFQLVKYFEQFKLIKLRLVVGLPAFDKILESYNFV